MTDKELLKFSTFEISPLVDELNNKIRELYAKKEKCYISVYRNEKQIGPSPVLHIDLFHPGVNRGLKTL